MFTRLLTCSLLATLTCLALADAPPAKPDAPANKFPAGFEQLKSLVGKWRTTEGDKAGATVTWQLTANGSTLMETMDCMGQPMISMYHPDNQNVMMTHYCAAQNQPRMRADPFKPGDKSITFNFLDATNLPDANAGYMHNLIITFIDADHMNEAWTFWKDGKEAQTVTLKYERVKG